MSSLVLLGLLLSATSDAPLVETSPETVGSGETAAADDADARYRTILRFHRERLRVLPVTRAVLPSPILMGSFNSRWFGDPMPWGLGYGGGYSVSDAPNDWVVVRGAAEVIDELDLARLLRDDALAERVEEARFWPPILWAAGFGTMAIATAGSGAWLARHDDRDLHAWGLSLVTVGAVSAVLALLFPMAEPTHVLSAAETELRTDDYNEKLRARLDLGPQEITAPADLGSAAPRSDALEGDRGE